MFGISGFQINDILYDQNENFCLALFSKKKCEPVAARILAILLGSALKNEYFWSLHPTRGSAVVLRFFLKVGTLLAKKFPFLARI